VALGLGQQRKGKSARDASGDVPPRTSKPLPDRPQARGRRDPSTSKSKRGKKKERLSD